MLTKEDKIELWQLAHTYCFIFTDFEYEPAKLKDFSKRISGHPSELKSIQKLYKSIDLNPLLEKISELVESILQGNNENVANFYLGYVPQMIIESATLTTDQKSKANTKLTEYFWNNIFPNTSEYDQNKIYLLVISNQFGGRIDRMFNPN